MTKIQTDGRARVTADEERVVGSAC